MKTIRKKKANLGLQYDSAIVDSPDSKTHFKSRFKNQSFTPKETSPGVVTISIGKAKPSRPQLKERMGAGGTKARLKRKAKNRRAVAEGKVHDPGPTPYASTEVNYVGPKPGIKKGYIKGQGWPKDSTGVSVKNA